MDENTVSIETLAQIIFEKELLIHRLRLRLTQFEREAADKKPENLNERG